MTSTKTILNILLTSLFFLSLTSFNNNTKSHLIVGNWEIIEKQKMTLRSGNELIVENFFFSSDEFTSSFSLRNAEGKEIEIDLAYKIYENYKDYKKPLIAFKSTCEEKLLIVFSIEQLSKSILELKFQKKLSSKNVQINKELLKFNRSAGPSENME